MFAPALVFALAAALGLTLTAVGRRLARRAGLVDAPDGRRKLHPHPVPLAGGPAVVAATVVALAVASALTGDLAADPARAAGLVVGVLLAAAVGLWDDARPLRARWKLLGQLPAAAAVVAGGVRIDAVSAGGADLPLGPLAGLVTVGWLLLTMNGFNLLDGLDGFLGTVVVTTCAGLVAAAVLGGAALAGWVAVAVGGATVGFLWFNRPPARVYLGDSGSLALGLAVGAAAVDSLRAGPAVPAVALVAAFALPLLDTLAAVVRRPLLGRGLAAPDRDHLHHVLVRGGLTHRQTLAFAAAVAAVGAAGGVVATVLRTDLPAALAVGAVVAMLAARGFGVAEFRLVCGRVFSITARSASDGRLKRPSLALRAKLDDAPRDRPVAPAGVAP